jgi:hypothetical protein
MMRQLLKRVLGIAELLMASSLKNPFHLLPVLAEFNYKKNKPLTKRGVVFGLEI